MESTPKDANQSKTGTTLDVTKAPPKSGRFPTFIRDKLAYFRAGSTLSNYRRHLREAEDKVLALADQCRAFRQEAESSAAKEGQMSRAYEARLADVTAAYRAQLASMGQKRDLMEKNMDNLLRNATSLDDGREKLARLLRAAETQLRVQESERGALSGRLLLAEQKRGDLQKRLGELEAKYATQEAVFEVKRKDQVATFLVKFAEQKALFDGKYTEQEAMFDTKYTQQEEAYTKQQWTFAAKYQAQEAMFDSKCKEQKAAFDAKYKAQDTWFDRKCRKQQEIIDTKHKEQEATLTAKLQDERRQNEVLQEQKEAVLKRLRTTETALLKSRQVKVTQEYEFTDTVNSLVPKEELKCVEEQCVLYKKLLSVLAALVLVLLGMVFVGSRFLFY